MAVDVEDEFDISIEIGGIVVSGETVRLGFSVAQQVTVSQWGDNTLDLDAIKTSPYDLALDDGSGLPAYLGVMLLQPKDAGNGQAPERPAGMVRMVVKTAAGDDWENAQTVLETDTVDVSTVQVGSLFAVQVFPPGGYQKRFRLYYEVQQSLENAWFYAFITNQPSVDRRLSFVKV
ncbi:hypothetical protein CUZ56_01859 [Saezia sanguinis]|uniref:Uncharacterized protein n=1 Tax=Saezia sanguinis TaxID=1965230 RepID=A0A433SCX1_9BURK|nr:hypothetical protein [Saezia sanguinis]RUS66579.1 hypothetical protein CUZ56_01859 [Saezia sanguinis]